MDDVDPYLLVPLNLTIVECMVVTDLLQAFHRASGPQPLDLKKLTETMAIASLVDLPGIRRRILSAMDRAEQIAAVVQGSPSQTHQ